MISSLCDSVSNTTVVCNKDIGEGGRLQMWSRGHFFIVRPCGHIDQWHPIYRYILVAFAYGRASTGVITT